jgi:uroporphyrinogen-III synthase
VRIACVGEGSARGLADLHLRVDCRPPVATAEALAAHLMGMESIENRKILVVTGSLNREILPKKLEDAGAIVDRLQVYKTEKTDLAAHAGAADFRARGADAILFASSSAVQSFVDQAAVLTLARGARRPLAGSIGPQTSATMRERGLPVDFEAKTPGFDGLLDALVSKLAAPGADPPAR